MKFLSILSIVLVLVVLSGCGVLDRSPKPEAPTPQSLTRSVNVEDTLLQTLKLDRGTSLFSVVTTNVTPDYLSFAMFRVGFYDKDGALLGTRIETIDGLKPQGVWKIERGVPWAGDVTFRLETVFVQK